ncbi:Uncharacterized protein APZ42_020627 [Daphnia magna]|uniref:Uncharacterized protein n=1 Tax=Daphnia magna TaxID=35525 RepID=A0A0P5WXG1_9CRUS|nr:Uncharacterized protein APZ42_020627 [Daphnia magna]
MSGSRTTIPKTDCALFFVSLLLLYLFNTPRSSPSSEISHVHYVRPLYICISRARKQKQKKVQTGG